MRLPKKEMKTPSNLMPCETSKIKILLHLNLLKMKNLKNSIFSCYMMIHFDLKPLRSHKKLPKQNPKSMHPIFKCIWELNNKAIPQLHKMFYIKGHLKI